MPPFENITPEPDVTDVTIGGVPQQMDDTDKAAVSVYGADSAAGDVALNASASGNLEVDLQVAGVPLQMDDTDKVAVSLYGTGTADGNSAVLVASDASPNLRVSLYNLTTAILSTVTGNDGAANSVDALNIISRGFLSNGASWDRHRNNTEITLLASAARTATVASSDQTNFNARGVIITFDVTVDPSTASLTMDIEFKDNVSDVYESLLLTSSAIVAVGTSTYIVYPGVGAASADVTQVAGFPLGRTWRINVTAADAESITYSVGASYIL